LLKKKPQFEAKRNQIEKSNLQVSSLISEEEIISFYEKLIRYFNILNRNLSDTIPKIVVVSLVKDYYGGLENYLAQELSENLDQLSEMKEDSNLTARRKIQKDVLDKLIKSREILQNFDGNL